MPHESICGPDQYAKRVLRKYNSIAFIKQPSRCFSKTVNAGLTMEHQSNNSESCVIAAKYKP